MTSSASDTSPTRVAAPDPPTDEGREGSVREKLEETRIDERKRQSLEFNDPDMKEVPGSSDGRGRLRKKRSLDDMQEAEAASDTKHIRKRSRELDDKDRPAKKEKAEGDETNGKTIASNTISASTISAEVIPKPVPNEPSIHESGTTKITEQTAPQDQNPASPSTTPKLSPTSGFGNASSKSPFASLDSSKSPFASSGGATNGSRGGGFASSGFASFAKSASSPFGALSPSKPEAQPRSTEEEKSSTANEVSKEPLSFASSAAQSSGFSALAGQKKSVFGGELGSTSPFVSATASGAAPLKSFASSSAFGGANGLSGAKPTKTFDDAADEENSDGEGAEDESAHTVGTETENRQDERFYEQDLETGEEGEKSVFTRRAKLYYMPAGAWKERGVGVFKVNCKKVKIEGEAEKPADANADAEEEEEDVEAGSAAVVARFIFRTDGNHRTMLNSPVTKDVSFKERPGDQNGKSRIFTGFVDGRPTPCLITVRAFNPLGIAITGGKH